MSRRLHLVRHGAAEGVEGRAVGQVDPPLSQAGRRAVHRLGKTWQGTPPEHLVTSDLRRARASAEVLAELWSTEARVDPRWREMDFGRWDGREWEEIHATDEQRLARWGEEWERRGPPGGESFHDLVRRVSGWYDDWRATGPPASTVVVAHSGAIRALLTLLLDLSREEIWQVSIQTARVTSVELAAGGPHLLALDASAFPPKTDL